MTAANSNGSGSNSDLKTATTATTPPPLTTTTSAAALATIKACAAASKESEQRTLKLLGIRFRDTTRCAREMQKERDEAVAQIGKLRKRKRQLDEELGPAEKKVAKLEDETERAKTEAAVTKVVGAFLDWERPGELLEKVVARFGRRLVPIVEGVERKERDRDDRDGGEDATLTAKAVALTAVESSDAINNVRSEARDMEGVLPSPQRLLEAPSVVKEEVRVVNREGGEPVVMIKREEQQSGEGEESGGGAVGSGVDTAAATEGVRKRERDGAARTTSEASTADEDGGVKLESIPDAKGASA